MQIEAISETPNQKYNKNYAVRKRSDNKSDTYTHAADGQPEFINRLFDIEGVTSIFYVMDFISVDKENDKDWDELIPKIQEKFNA